MQAKLIVGLEIHVQLATRTKLFCGCELAFADPPNSHVCPVCLGLPGALPVMNRKAYEYSVRTALALHCEIAPFTKWDRKSYYYPDLPKNYQISQYDLPLGREGFIEIPLTDGSTKKIGILRAHLEEDAGKNLHEGLDHSRVDLNRTGTPLLEIVTHPDLNSPEECGTLARELQRLVRFIGVSEADMQKGHMRFEPNINLHITDQGREYRTPIIEVKNLNSFRALERAVAYEQWRQLQEWNRDHDFTLARLGKQNRGWDDSKNETVFQREKEEAHDYRYFPDPDLVPIEIDAPWLEQIRSTLGELPLDMTRRFIQDYGLSEYDAGVLTADRPTAEFFDAALAAGGPAKRTANLITQTGLKLANERNCRVDRLGASPAQLARLAALIDDATLNASAGEPIFLRMLADTRDPGEIAQELNLVQKSDAAELATLLDQVLAENPQALADASSDGKKAKKARGFLLGQVMRKTKNQANPQVLAKLLDQRLGG